MIKNESGQITVFLSMIFFVFLGLAFCVLEGMHGYMESALVEEAFEEAGNEILASYDKYLFDKYYVFFLDPRERKYIKKEAMDFLNHYGMTETYGFSCRKLSLTEEKAAVEEKGLFLRYQIAEFMKYYKTVQTKDQLKNLINSLRRNADEAVSDGSDFYGNEDNSSSGEDMWTYDENSAESDDKGTDDGVADARIARDRLSWSELRQSLDLAVKSGILLYAVDQADMLSSASVKTSGLPSKEYGGALSERLNKISFSWNSLSQWRDYFETKDIEGLDTLDLTRDKKLMEYLFICFRNYRSPQAKELTALQYEMEYLIAGRSNDRDNLRYVAERIMIMRFIINYHFASHNAELLEEADDLAESLAGSLGFSEGTDTVKVLLIAALSYGESLLELHALMKGGSVACTKNDSNWNLSFENAASKLSSRSSIIAVNNGVKYEDYLKLLLYLSFSKKELIYRMMDIMQLNTALYEPGFKMEECLFSYKWTGKMNCSRWFISFPGIDSTAKQMFDMEIQRHVSY